MARIQMVDGVQAIVDPVGTAGAIFRVRCYGKASSWSFDVRTASRRRFLVVNLASRQIVKRSDSVAVAYYTARRTKDALVIDRADFGGREDR